MFEHVVHSVLLHSPYILWETASIFTLGFSSLILWNLIFHWWHKEKMCFLKLFFETVRNCVTFKSICTALHPAPYGRREARPAGGWLARQGPTAPKGCPQNNAFFWSCFRPTSDDNISRTVYPIYLKIYVQRVPTGHSSHNNFQVNPINHFRNIDIGSWPKKNYIIFGAPFIWQTEVACRPPRMYKYVFFNCVHN